MPNQRSGSFAEVAAHSQVESIMLPQAGTERLPLLVSVGQRLMSPSNQRFRQNSPSTVKPSSIGQRLMSPLSQLRVHGIQRVQGYMGHMGTWVQGYVRTREHIYTGALVHGYVGAGGAWVHGITGGVALAQMHACTHTCTCARAHAQEKSLRHKSPLTPQRLISPAGHAKALSPVHIMLQWQYYNNAMITL